MKYHRNNPNASASEIAQKIKTTPNYVWKTLSQARKPSRDVRGRKGRIFAHGKVFYEWWVTPSSAAALRAPVINSRTGMKQIGLKERRDPCSCQIHSKGQSRHLWPDRLPSRILSICPPGGLDSPLIFEKGRTALASRGESSGCYFLEARSRL